MLPKPLHMKFEGLCETNSMSRYESFKLEGGAQALDYSSDEDFVPTPKNSPFHCDSQESSFSSISSSEGYNDLDIEFQTKPKKPKLVKKPRRPANLWSKVCVMYVLYNLQIFIPGRKNQLAFNIMRLTLVPKSGVRLLYY